jgi:hypothetical protein
MASNKPIKYSQLNASDIIINNGKELTPNDNCAGQLTGWFNIKKSQVITQTPWSSYFTGGTPKYNEKYYDTDAKRQFYRYAFPCELSHFGRPEEMGEEQVEYFNKLIQENEDFRLKMVEIDEVMTSDEIKKQMFGKKADKYTYIPIVRPVDDEDDDDDEDEEKTKKKIRFKYSMKMKLDIDWNTKNISTKVYKMNGGTLEKPKEPEECEAETVDEFIEVVPYRSRVRCIMKIVKVWAHPPKNKNPEYGLTLKLMKIQVVPTLSGGSSNADCDFDDSDDEIESDGEVIEKPSEVFANKEEAAEESDESEDSESEDSDSEDEAPPPPKTKGRGKSKTK